MAVVDLTLGLEGDVSLDVFGRAAEYLDQLAAAITAEQSFADAVTWQASGAGLERGATSVAGECVGDDMATGILHRYLAVGRILAGKESATCSQPVRSIAAKMALLLDEGVAALRFDTAIGTAWAPYADPESREAPGCVTGWREPQAAPVGVRFALLDDITGQSVSCYLDQPDHDLHEALRDRRITVYGLVSRQAFSKHPSTVRAITKIELDPRSRADGWEQAMQTRPGIPGAVGSVTWFLEERERARERFWRER